MASASISAPLPVLPLSSPLAPAAFAPPALAPSALQPPGGPPPPTPSPSPPPHEGPLQSAQATNAAAASSSNEGQPEISFITYYAGRLWENLEAIGVAIRDLFWRVINNFLRLCEHVQYRFRGNDPAVVSQYGHGIENAGNSCYLGANIQAIRFTPALFQRPSGHTIQQAAAAAQLQELIDQIQPDAAPRIPRSGNPIVRRNITAEQIDLYRQQLIHANVIREPRNANARPGNAQMDAIELSQLLLARLGGPTFTIDIVPQGSSNTQDKTTAHANTTATASLAASSSSSTSSASSRRLAAFVQSPEGEQNQLSLNISIVPDNTAVSDLLYWLPDGSYMPITQLHMYEKHIPRMLTIGLGRYDEQGNKSWKRILPSQALEFPVEEQPGKVARFTLTAIIAQMGNEQGGHYVMFKPDRAPNQLSYVEFNDERVFRFQDPTVERRNFLSRNTVSDDIAQNNTLLYYQFEAIVQESA